MRERKEGGKKRLKDRERGRERKIEKERDKGEREGGPRRNKER